MFNFPKRRRRFPRDSIERVKIKRKQGSTYGANLPERTVRVVVIADRVGDRAKWPEYVEHSARTGR